MKRRLTMAAALSLLLSSLTLVESAKASELEWLCGDYSFLGSAQVYVGRMSNGRENGLVLYDARSDSGRVLALYAWGPRPDGSGGQGCGPSFGKIDGDVLVLRLSRNTKATYKFEESGKVSLEWSRKHRNGKLEKQKGTLKKAS